MCEHVLTSMFAVLSVGYQVISCQVKMSTSTEQKLDKLKELFSTSMLALKQSHEETRISMGTKISKLKEDLATAKEQQEDAIERAVKLARREHNLDFNRKGHDEQFLFNQQVWDNIATASRQLGN